ncbi:MAG: VOC family protein [Pseudomonadota bacterium]
MSVEGIDHLIIAVRSVDKAIGLFSNLGFNVTPEGEHLKFKSKNTLAMLDRAYLEIAAPTARESFGESLFKHLDNQDEGFFGVAFNHNDAKAFADSTGLSYAEAEREVDTDLHKGVAKFRVAWLPDETIPHTLCFIVEHATPELVWHPELQKHKNGAEKIETLYLRNDFPEQAAANVRHKLQLPETDGNEVSMLTNSIIFLNAKDMGSKWGEAAQAAVEFSGQGKPEVKHLFDGKLVFNFLIA